MRRFLAGSVVVLAVLGGLIAFHLVFPDEYVGICTNAKTHLRLPDKDCQPIKDSDNGWSYYDSNSEIPAVGEDGDDGSADAPDEDEVKRGGVPAQGQQADANSDVGNGNVEPPIGGAGDSDIGVNSGDEGGDENVGSGGGEDGE